MNNPTISRPPFVKWRRKRVMTFVMIDKFLKKKPRTAWEAFFKHKERFIVGRDAYFIDGIEAYDYLPEGTTHYRTTQLWLITESGYQILTEIMHRKSRSKRKNHIEGEA